MAVTRTNAPAGSGEYGAYSALWHLFQIGIIESNSFESAAWSKAEDALKRGPAGKRATRVALIDTSVAWTHPNLVGAIDTGLMIDFFSARLGAFPDGRPDGWPSILDKARAAGSPMPAGHAATTLHEALLERLGQHEPSPGKSAVRPAASPAFSAHGTAMAGLIGARPAKVTEHRPKVAETPHVKLLESNLGNQERTLPYVGADPFCEIVPISTNQEPDPEQYILALLYAVIIDADIIVLPRDIPDPFRSPAIGTLRVAGPFADQGAYPVQINGRDTRLWTAFSELIVEVSKRRPVLCAAGNGSDDVVIYPANLAADDNGIIAVGARNALGLPSSFTSKSNQHAKVTVYAPSGDASRLDREVRRLDTIDDDFQPSEHDEEDLSEAGDFATEDIITTDVPGPGGYNGSRFRKPTSTDGAYRDVSSLFCRFSGTSAAVAIAGGLLSLAMSSDVLRPGNGIAAKRWLRQAGEGRRRRASGEPDDEVPTIAWSATATPSPAERTLTEEALP